MLLNRHSQSGSGKSRDILHCFSVIHIAAAMISTRVRGSGPALIISALTGGRDWFRFST